MITSEELKTAGLRAGADKVGIASAANITDMYPDSVPGNFLKGATSVVISLAADPSAIYDTDDSNVYSRLAFPGYRRADGSTAVLMKLVEDRGYSTKYVVREWVSGKNTKGKNSKVLQIKHAAHAAGLGTPGKHTLIVTKEYSAAVRFSAFITDAPLQADAPATENLCDDCNACVKACPSGAIQDKDNFDFFACSAYLFGGLKLKNIMQSIKDGNLKNIPEMTSSFPEVINGWGKSFSAGQRLYYYCGNCVRSCKKHK